MDLELELELEPELDLEPEHRGLAGMLREALKGNSTIESKIKNLT